MQLNGLHTHMDLPGWKGHFWKQDKNPFEMARDSAPVLFVPGTQFHYSNPGIGLLNYVVMAGIKESGYADIREYLRERVFEPIGIKESEYSTGYNKTFLTDGYQVVPGWGGGSFSAQAVARIGRLMLNNGTWEGKQIISPEIVEKVLRYNGKDLPNLEEKSNDWPVSESGIAPTLGWYCNRDGIWEYLPRDAFAGAGAQNQLLMVIPSLKMIIVRSATGEKVGQGKYGPKASGMLMVDGVLYMIARNSGNAQLAWSEDYGKTWEWADWRFGEGFGCPVFLDGGKNYRDAKDGFVYIYSFDEESAYKISDHMVLARVPKEEVKTWKAYTYFSGMDAGKPRWTEDVRKRKPVFENPAKCYRNGISYNKVLDRYLWCQIIPVSSGEELQGIRFKGGLGIFESANPWGPWKTVYYTNNWDIGPGETGCIPTKWISEDGKNCYYLFSVEDCFSVRKLTFITGEN